MWIVLSVLWHFIQCPITTLFLLLINWFWVKIFIQDWDPKLFSNSYADLYAKNQYWRIWSSQISHISVLHLWVNCLTLYSLRHIELKHGSLFYFKYSILLVLVESIFSMTVLNFIIKAARASPFADNLQQLMTNMPMNGCSGLCLAWLAYQATNYRQYEEYSSFQLLMFLSIDPALAPILMVTMFYLCFSRNYAVSIFCGLSSGYLLGFGPLQLLDSTYWSLCFIMNVIVAIISSVYGSQHLTSNSIATTGTSAVVAGRELISLPVLLIGDASFGAADGADIEMAMSRQNSIDDLLVRSNSTDDSDNSSGHDQITNYNTNNNSSSSARINMNRNRDLDGSRDDATTPLLRRHQSPMRTHSTLISDL